MWRRWLSWRRREKDNAEGGTRNVEQPWKIARRTFLSLPFRVPRSHFRVRGGGAAMKYFVTVGTQTIEVEVEGTRVVVGGVPLETDLAAVSGTPLYHLLLGGESWTVAVEPLEGAGRWALGLVGGRGEASGQDGQARRTVAWSGPHRRGADGTARPPAHVRAVRSEA